MMRAEGFYWIALAGGANDWIIAEYHDGKWWIPMLRQPTDEGDIYEIDERRIVRAA